MRKIYTLPILLLVLAGCSSSSDVTAPTGPAAQAAVESSAATAAATAPMAEAARVVVAGSLGSLAGCPATFDFGSLSGSCAEDGDGVLHVDFSGDVDLPMGPAQIVGTLTATPSGGSFTYVLDATATGGDFTATWHVTGAATPGSGGGSPAVSAQSQISVQKGASTLTASVLVTAGSLGLTVSSGGQLVAFSFDRATMTGTASVGGTVIATIAIVDGCAEIDFVDPSIPDSTVCPD